MNNSSESAPFFWAEWPSTQHPSLYYSQNLFVGYYLSALWSSSERGPDSLLRKLFGKELCWLQGKNSVVGDGCWGLSVLRGTLKLPKAFSRLVPFCQKYLRSRRAVSQLWKMQQGNSSRKDKKGWQNQEEQYSASATNHLIWRGTRMFPLPALRELCRRGGTAKC